jgi:Uma2 family endonuclease
MGMPEMARSWTREMVLALPDDGNRYELFGGELLVTPAPAPRHEYVVMALLERLIAYLAHTAVGHAGTSPAALALGGHELAQPDIYVMPGPRGRAPQHWEDLGLPILVVEVLSPSTALNDRQIKRKLFQHLGIPEYWIVDPDARQVERWRPDDLRPEVLDESIEWHPPAASEALHIDLVAVFAEVLGPP